MKLQALRRREAVFAFVMVIAVCDVIAMGIVMPVLPSLIEEFTGSNARAGFINGVFLAIWAGMQFLCSPIAGSLSDRFGRRPVLLLSAAGLGLDYVLMALAPNLWWLALGRVIAGATTASFTTVYAYMADISTDENRAKAMGMVGAAFSGGFVLGPLFGGALGELGPRAPFWAAAILSGLTFLYGAFILPESLAPEKRMAFSWKRANPFGAFALLSSHKELLGLSLTNFVMFFAHWVFPAVFVLYAQTRYGWSPLQVGFIFAFWGAMDMIVQLFLVDRAVKRFGERRLMIFGLSAGVVGFIGMGIAPAGPIFILAQIPAACMGFAMPTIMSLMTKRVSESEQGQLQGANMSVVAVAGVVAPIFFGWVYEVSVKIPPLFPHIGAAFFIGAALMFASAVLGWITARLATREESAQQS